MSQTKKVDKLTIRPKDSSENTISTGANTEILLNGVPLKGVTFIKCEWKAKGVCKVMMEMYAQVDIETNVELSTAPSKEKIYLSGTAFEVHQIGSLNPVGVVPKKE